MKEHLIEHFCLRQDGKGSDFVQHAGMVSLLPTIDSRLFKIKDGNRQLAQRLINATDAQLHMGQRVTLIHRNRHGKFEVQTTPPMAKR